MAVTKGHGKITGRGNTFIPISSSYSDIAAITQFTFVENTYSYLDFEPTAGNYDFSKVGADLDYLYAQGGTKKLGIAIPFATFNSKNRFTPSHWGGAGVAYVEASNGARLIRLWDSAIRTKMKATHTALATYIAAHAHGSLATYVNGSETAAGNYGGEAVGAAAHQAALLDFVQHCCSVLTPSVNYRVQAQWSLSNIEQFIRDCYTAGVRQMGGPDIDPYDAGLYPIMLLYAQLAEELGFSVHYNFEFANYLPTNSTRSFTFPPSYPDPVWAGRTVSNTVGNAALDAEFFTAIINYSVYEGHLDVISWLPRSGSSTAGLPDLGFSDGIIPAVDDAVNTAIFPPAGSSPPPPPPPSSSSWECKPQRRASPTSTGALTFPHGCSGAVKGGLLHGDTATTDDTNSNGSIINFGAFDGTRQWACTLRANNGVTSGSYVSGRGMSDQSFARLLGGSGNIDGEFAFSSVDAANINFTCGNEFAAAGLINALFVAGDGAECYAKKISLTTQDTTVTETPGWTLAAGDILMGFVLTTDITWDDAAHAGAGCSVGLFTYDGTTLKQMCRSQRTVDNTYNTNGFAEIHVTRVGEIIATGGTSTFTVEVGVTGTTLTFTPRDGNANSDIGIFVKKLSSAEVNMIADDLPVSADLSGGLYSHNVGVTTDFAYFLNSMLTATGSIASDGTAGAWGLGLMGPSQSYTIASTRQDNVATVNVRSRASQRPVYLYEHSGSTKRYDATVSSVTNPADKITLAYGTVAAARTKAIIAAVGRVSTIAATLTPVTVPSTIDLTASSTDYVRLGIGTATSIERKANGGNQVSVSSNNAPAGRFGGGSTNYPQFTATDSAPSGALNASAERPYWNQVGDIVTFIVPANNETANFKAWINASGVDVEITVADSSGVLDDFVDTLESADTASGNIQRGLVDVNFISNLAGSSIIVAAEITAVNAAGGNMSVQAGKLLNNYVAVNEPPDFVFGFPRFISMTETAPDSGLYDIIYGVQASETGEIFGQIRLGSNTATPQAQQVESGVDGNGSATDVVVQNTGGNQPIDQFQEVQLLFEDVPGDDLYNVDIGLVDADGLYSRGIYSVQVQTPAPSTGGGGGEGPYSVTVQLDNGAGALTVNTPVRYAWIDSSDLDFDSATTFSGTWAPATSGTTGLLTVQRSATDTGYLVVIGENGEFYRSTELTPA